MSYFLYEDKKIFFEEAGSGKPLILLHGKDWKNVLEADTEAVVEHARKIGDFFHHPLSDLQTRLLLTGSSEDEMFPKRPSIHKLL